MGDKKENANTVVQASKPESSPINKRFFRDSDLHSRDHEIAQTYLSYFAGNIALMGIANPHRTNTLSQERSVKAAWVSLQEHHYLDGIRLLGIYPLVFDPHAEIGTLQTAEMVKAGVSNYFNGRVVTANSPINARISNSLAESYNGLVEVTQELTSAAGDIDDGSYRLSARSMGFIAVTSPKIVHYFCRSQGVSEGDKNEDTVAILDQVVGGNPQDNRWTQFKPRFEAISPDDPSVLRVEELLGSSATRSHVSRNNAITRAREFLKRI
jgi:hypothetical protein